MKTKFMWNWVGGTKENTTHTLHTHGAQRSGQIKLTTMTVETGSFDHVVAT